MRKEKKIYDEVNPYTGERINYRTEDAPANATGPAVAGTGDDSSVVVVKKKKKDNKMFLDARTKAYKISSVKNFCREKGPIEHEDMATRTHSISF